MKGLILTILFMLPMLCMGQERIHAWYDYKDRLKSIDSTNTSLDLRYRRNNREGTTRRPCSAGSGGWIVAA